MTDAKLETQTTRRFDIGRVFSTLIRPRHTFTATASETRSTWLTPMLVISLTALLAVLVNGYINGQAALNGSAPLPPNWDSMTPEMQSNYQQAQQISQGAVLTYVLPMVGSLFTLWIGWFVFAGALHLGSTLLGGRGALGGALNITAWGMLPLALRDILRILYILMSGHTITSPSLSGFATGVFAVQLLAHIDLFMIWCVVLLIIGFSIADGLPRGKAALGVVIVLAILLSARAGLGTLVANLGSSLQGGFF